MSLSYFHCFIIQLGKYLHIYLNISMNSFTRSTVNVLKIKHLFALNTDVLPLLF